MPLSKARDRERKRLRNTRLESNLISDKNFQPVMQPATEQVIPVYNPLKHRPGDKVRLNGRVITVPEVDVDGNPIW